MPVFLLSERIAFPPVHLARTDGLLAAGGDLSEERLLLAYRMGIFPWYAECDPILWWSPDPRLVLFPGELRVSRSLKKTIRQKIFQVTLDTSFEAVIAACAQTPRKDGQGTWIVEEMIQAYCRLHRSGYAHSAEAWYEGKLAGGVYGVSLGGCFFGESMFTRVADASKVAFVTLVDYLRSHAVTLIDCQVTTRHLMRFGAREIPRKLFIRLLDRALEAPTRRGCWSSG